MYIRPAQALRLNPWSFRNVPGRRLHLLRLALGMPRQRALMANKSHVSPAQVRAARAWLNWTQDDLSARSGVSQRSIARYELELSAPYVHTQAKIRQAFESAGICFQFEGTIPKGIRVI